MGKKIELDAIAERIASCQKCPLYKTATNPVPGNGSAEAEILFIGEAPGFNEDQKGIPFCGAAGHLLDQLLTEIGLARDKVFVANMLKHRPPDNRDPLPEEMEACKDYLDEQIKVIKPKCIVTLGRFSMAKFLPYGKISVDHGKGKLIDYEGTKYVFIPMFHPAAALRATQVANQLHDDFKKMGEEIKRLEEVMHGVVETPVTKVEGKKEEQLTLV